jgi:hypothetical protein
MDANGGRNGAPFSQTRIILVIDMILEAEEAMKAGEVPVGCVFVRDGVIIAKARNRTNELRNVRLPWLHILSSHSRVDVFHPQRAHDMRNWRPSISSFQSPL